MDQLRKTGDLLKRHWEKALLALALIGLIGAVVYLNRQRAAEDEKIQAYEVNIQRRRTKGVPSVDLAELSKARENATNAPALNLGLPHNLFNPVKWQRRPDGTVIKIQEGTEVGPSALRIVRIAPLHTIITLDKPAGNGLNMSVTQEASTNAYWRRKIASYVTSNATHSTRMFTLRAIGGTPEEPEATIELASGERLTVAQNKPYSVVAGHRVDLTYPPAGNRGALPDRRVGDVLSLEGEDYIIVAITPNEVVVSARSNNRRTTIRNNAAP